MLVAVKTINKKCVVETEYWFCDKEDSKDKLIEIGFTEDEYKDLPDRLTMTKSDVYRWGEIAVNMPKEDFEEMDWENNDEWDATQYDREDWSFSDGCGDDQDYDFEMGEKVDDYDMDDFMREYGDVDECEVSFIGPLNAEIIDEDG
jgi:hypothetical protein